MASGYLIGQCRHGTFPSKKFILDTTVLDSINQDDCLMYDIIWYKRVNTEGKGMYPLSCVCLYRLMWVKRISRATLMRKIHHYRAIYSLRGLWRNDHKPGWVILMNLNPLIHSPGSDNPSCEITSLSIIIITEISNIFYSIAISCFLLAYQILWGSTWFSV